MILARSLNCIFIHVHKTGGTSLKMALNPFLRWDDLLLGGTALGEAMNEHFRRRYGLHKHSSIEDVQKICGAGLVSDAYCFALVRHPVSRMLSLYNFVGSIAEKWARNNEYSLDQIKSDLPRFVKLHPPLGWPASRAFLLSSSFDEFLDRPELLRDVAFFTQVSRLSIDGKLVCSALKLEEVSCWLPDLMVRLGIQFELPKQNISTCKNVSEASLLPATIRKVETIFQEDYVQLMY
jgi:hypothetical protein